MNATNISLNNNNKLLNIINYLNSLRPTKENEIKHFKDFVENNDLKTLQKINNLNFYKLGYVYLTFNDALQIVKKTR